MACGTGITTAQHTLPNSLMACGTGKTTAQHTLPNSLITCGTGITTAQHTLLNSLRDLLYWLRKLSEQTIIIIQFTLTNATRFGFLKEKLFVIYLHVVNLEHYYAIRVYVWADATISETLANRSVAGNASIRGSTPVVRCCVTERLTSSQRL